MELRAGPLGLTYENGTLFLEGKELAPDIRKAGDMRGVMYDEAFAGEADEKLPLYRMYRNLMPHLETAGIRYDVTILSETVLGREFNKTLGHYHPVKSAGRTYAEIYEVLFGEAHYLMQKPSPGGALVDVVLVKAKAGDAVPIPPNYGHVTINPGDRELVMANLVSSRFDSKYEEYVARHGAAFYELVDGSFVKNENWKSEVDLRVVEAKPTLYGPDIIASYMETPEAFEFLRNPERWVGEG